MTSDDLEGSLRTFEAHRENLNEDRPYYQRRRRSPMTLDSDDIRFMRIYAVVPRKVNGHFALNSVVRRYVWSSEGWLSKFGNS